jgi:hypothetical protein
LHGVSGIGGKGWSLRVGGAVIGATADSPLESGLP